MAAAGTRSLKYSLCFTIRYKLFFYRDLIKYFVITYKRSRVNPVVVFIFLSLKIDFESDLPSVQWERVGWRSVIY